MRPLLHLLQTALNDRDELESISAGFVDDASRLNRTQVAEVRAVSGFWDNPEEQLRAHLQHARARKLPLSIAGTRHTMGGQTFTPGGIILDMLGLHEMELDEQMTVLRVQAGALWSNVLSYVHERGCSIKVMQSNNSFSVGGSLSANCHGWQPMSSPISSTVVAFRLLLADGTIVRCSREGHAELFSLALGGYGLFGVLIDTELSVTENERYRLTHRVVPSAEYPAFYEEKIKRDAHIGLAYGRLNVEPDHFLREILLSTYSVIPNRSLSPLGKPDLAGIRRLVFRGSVGSAYGKALRWDLEKRFGQIPLVMLFNQPRTQQADQQMAYMTRELIEAALALGGRYYLPYRLHAAVEQFYRAYPQAQQFFQLKRKYDPEELFQNELYRKYGAVSGV